ncbi:MAG: sugar ABC transporter permease, partial [Alphaproteobacteria bacterium]|nr:sugar ABC transporter permease [Alphaproteobacteria bacterium]
MATILPAAGHARRAHRLAPDVVLGVVLLLLVGLLTVAPVIYVLVSSFNIGTFGKPFQFGLEGWIEVFSSGKTLGAIGYSILLAIRIPIGIAIAFLIAWLLIRVRIPGAIFIEHALWFGFFLPPLPITMGWILLLEEHYGLLNHVF